jgi:hypothetical protein
MRARTWAGAALTVGFVAVVVVQATAANQCPVRGQGACAKVHEMLMRPPPVGPLVLLATPMRAGAGRG